MRVVVFCHSLVSDWNNGHAHFLRGLVAELRARGHDVDVLEPADSWSRRSLIAERGPEAVAEFRRRFPNLESTIYDPRRLDLRAVLADADLVLVHEWNDPELVRTVGELRHDGGRFRLLFHDTHHRAATAPEQIEEYDLSGYDGVLAYGESLRDLYLARGWTSRAWTWHEAADTRIFRRLDGSGEDGELVWIGNWGDGERSDELHEFLLEPARAHGLSGSVYGVRYPPAARRALRRVGLAYRGWLPNYLVPEVFARHRVTVHVPRRPYVEALPGIPTIRPFEALACEIPLVVAGWRDMEHLFAGPGDDYLFARDGDEMARHLETLLRDRGRADALARRGAQTIAERHTCAHRVDELLAIRRELELEEVAA